MASISTTSERSGQKAVDHEIPLIPFIDLLLCCIMFLLVTAVWNQMASVSAGLDAPGDPAAQLDQPPPSAPLAVLVGTSGYRLTSDAGDEIQIPLAGEGAYDVSALREHLRARRRLDPGADQAVVSADDGVRYESVLEAVDELSGGGFSSVTVTGSP